MVLCNVTTSGFRNRDLHFGGEYCLHFQGRYVDNGGSTFHISVVPNHIHFTREKCQLFENNV